MFILDKAIKKWKSELRQNQALEDGYIKELEVHLRDMIDEGIGKGLVQEEAFNEAIIKIGVVENVGEEYYKIDSISFSKRPPWEAPKFIPMLYLNYFKIALRNLKRYKGYSFINIVGLTLGLASVLLITMIIKYELSFDNFHEKEDRIYRIYAERLKNGEPFAFASLMYPLAQTAQDEIPEIEEAVCIKPTTQLVSVNNNNFYDKIYYAGNNIFDIFTFDFVSGDKTTALDQPFRVAISETMATKYFGDENPIDQMLNIQGNKAYLVTAVFKDMPKNSHINLNIIVSAKTLNATNYADLNSWNNFNNDYAYLLLKKNIDPSTIPAKLTEVVKKHTNDDSFSIFKFYIQSLKDIHFSNLNYDLAKTTPRSFLYIFGIIAVFILGIACINFINLSTAKSAGRYREVGVRKVLGAKRLSLIKQFMSESFIIVFISFFFATIIAGILTTEVNDLLNVNLNLTLLSDIQFVLIILTILILTSFIAGFYPALFLSKAKPALVLKNILSDKKKGFSLRSALVVFQFAISVFLITGTLILYQQIEYLLTKDLGFESDQVLVLEIYDKNILENGEPLKNDLLNLPNINSASFSNGTPASNTSQTSGYYTKGSSDKDELRLQTLDVDYDFLKTYKMHLTMGRFFDKNHTTDKEVYLINEAAMRKCGWTDIENKRIKRSWDGEFLPVIGVIKDFHYSSLRDQIVPFIFRLRNGAKRFLSLKVKSTDISTTMNNISELFSKHSPAYPLESYFINDGFAKYYRTEKTLGKLLGTFTFLALVICGIGLFGLTAYSVEQRTKEIGIRKTLGASVASIIFLLSKEFIRLVILANIFIWPVAYYLLNQWLNNYAYRIEFNPLIFGITFMISIVTTLVIVGYYTARAAMANPVISLRTE